MLDTRPALLLVLSSSALASLTRILRRLFSYCCALLAMQVGPHYVLTFVILEQLRKLAR